MIHKKPKVISFLVVIAIGAGCRREQIRSYVAPKDPPPQTMAADNPHAGHEHGQEGNARPRPQIAYKLPAGWKENAPGRMSVASFSIDGAAGKEASVTVTPLPMLAGREADVLNMFREQAGMKPLEPEEVTKELRDVQVGSERGKLFELTGKGAAGEEPQRIITAMVHRSDSSWFYKLAGDESLVEAQRGAFLEFLKSIAIKEPAAESGASTAGHNWSVPGDWKEMPAGQMQVARFAVPEKNGAKAEVFVSVFDTDTGGTLANLNRWRRQIGLKDVSEAEAANLSKSIEGAPGSLLTELNNNGQQLIGAIVPRNGQYWFYKLLGGTDAVTPQRDNFVAFVKSNP